jgi:hypothetical protein
MPFFMVFSDRMTQKKGSIALHGNIIESKTGGKLTYGGGGVIALVPKSDVYVSFKLT